MADLSINGARTSLFAARGLIMKQWCVPRSMQCHWTSLQRTVQTHDVRNIVTRLGIHALMHEINLNYIYHAGKTLCLGYKNESVNVVHFATFCGIHFKLECVPVWVCASPVGKATKGWWQWEGNLVLIGFKWLRFEYCCEFVYEPYSVGKLFTSDSFR